MTKVAEDGIGKLNNSDKQCTEFSQADRARFWQKVNVTPTCWLWTGSANPRNGYGQFTTGGRGGTFRNLRTHRVAWELTHGPIPDDKHVLHSCDVPRCVNPAHLFLGTHRDNMQDAARKGRLHTSRPTRQKVSAEQLAEIDAALTAGERQNAIADRYGVSKGWMSQYVKGLRRQYDRPSGEVA